jgi:hypothetical protein
MIRRLEYIAITILWLGLRGNPAFAQVPAGSILHVEIVNSTLYRRRSESSTAKVGSFPLRLRTQRSHRQFCHRYRAVRLLA